MGLEAGRLRHRVTFQAREETQDATTGGVDVNWVDVFGDVPAAIEPLSARELMSAASLQSKVVSRITVRYRSGLSAAQRIVHGEKIYNPEGVIPDQNSGIEFVTIPCSEGTNEG